MICSKPHSSRQSGQVLIIGVFIMLILLFAILAGFDIYNAIRAKLDPIYAD